MKLPNPEACLLASGRGNVKQQTTLVEEQRIGFRTGVRFPSSPSRIRKQRIRAKMYKNLCTADNAYSRQ